MNFQRVFFLLVVYTFKFIIALATLKGIEPIPVCAFISFPTT